MNFTNKVQQQFTKAGWTEERNVLKIYDKDFINKVPKFLKEFLKEYGNLEVEDIKSYKSDVVNILQIDSRHILLISEDKDELDYLFPIIGKEVYLFAYFDPDGYYIGCDQEGRVYMIGDYVFLRSESFKEGLENIITDDWSNSLELNIDTGEWISKYSY